MAAKRKLKMKRKVSAIIENVVPATQIRTTERIVEEIGAKPSEVELDEVANGLDAEELLRMVDDGGAWHAEMKRLEGLVEKVKAILKVRGKQDDRKELSGEIFKCRIGPKTKTIQDGTTTDFAKILKRENRIKLFDSLTGIKMGDAKKALGEDALEGFFRKETETFGSVTFKPL